MPDDVHIQDELNAPVILPIVARLDGGADVGGRAMLSIFGEPQALQVFIENRSDRKFTLSPGTARISLMLRTGVLAVPDKVSLDPPTAAQWKLECTSDAVEGYVTLVLTPQGTLSLAPHEELQVGLVNVIPDNISGPRGTQVALDYEGFADEEGKSIADHLLLRLALADQKQGDVRVDLLRTGSNATDGVLSLTFQPDGDGLILTRSIKNGISLKLATATGQALEINASGPRTPALHIDRPSLEGGPEPTFEGCDIANTLITNDARTIEFNGTANITTAGTGIRLLTQAGASPGLHPVSIRYENFGPNCDIDGRLVVLIMSHPIQYYEKKAYADWGLVVRKSLDFQGTTGADTLSLNVTGGTAQIEGPTKGVAIKGGPLTVDRFVARTVEVSETLAAEKASVRRLEITDSKVGLAAYNAELPKTNVRGDLMFTDTLYGPRAEFTNMTLRQADRESHKYLNDWRAWVNPHGMLTFGMTQKNGELLQDPDDNLGTIELWQDGLGRNALGRLRTDHISAVHLSGADLRADGRFRTHDVEFEAMGGTTYATKHLPERMLKKIGGELPVNVLGMQLAPKGITINARGFLSGGVFQNKWQIRVQDGELLFFHNGVEVSRIHGTIASFFAGVEKT